MQQKELLKTRVLSLIREGLEYIYKKNARAKNRPELITSEILHILRLCGESCERLHWRVPRTKLMDMGFEDENTGNVNWSNETWHTSMALIALAPALKPEDLETRIHSFLKGAVDWILNERAGWKGTWDGELWETSLAVLALLYSKEAGLVSQHELRWVPAVLDWLIETGLHTKKHLGYHYMGLLLWALDEAAMKFKLNPELRQRINKTILEIKNFILNEIDGSPDLVMPKGACWMTGLILFGLLKSDSWTDDTALTKMVLDYFEDEREEERPQEWDDEETTYYVLLALIELFHYLNIADHRKRDQNRYKRARKKSEKELHDILAGIRKNAATPVRYIEVGCPIGHETCDFRDYKLLDERYDDLKVFLAIPFKKYEEQKEIICGVLKMAGLEPVVSDSKAEQSGTSTDILCQICQRISECRYGLADVTGIESKPNIAYEIGLLHAFNRKTGIIVMKNEQGETSIEKHFSDLKQLQYHVYACGRNRNFDLADKVKDWILSINASEVDPNFFIKKFQARWSKE